MNKAAYLLSAFMLFLVLWPVPALKAGEQAGLFGRPEDKPAEVKPGEAAPAEKKAAQTPAPEPIFPPGFDPLKATRQRPEELPYWLEDPNKKKDFYDYGELREVDPYWLPDDPPPSMPSQPPDQTQPSTQTAQPGGKTPVLIIEGEPLADATAEEEEPKNLFAPKVQDIPPPEPKTPPQAAAPQTAGSTPPGETRMPGHPDTIQISFFVFEDEYGIIHMTDAPTDPRFKMMTAEFTVSRGRGAKNVFNREKLRPYIMQAAATYNLDPALIAAIIKAESGFDSNAVSWAGAQGLMQLMPATARLVGCKDPFDPEANIMGGSRYIRMMLDQFRGDMTLAVAAYNCGPTRVQKIWRVPDITETKNYVKIVLKNYADFQDSF